MRHIGLFGGTFNPIHIGHIRLAINVYRDFKLDELIFIPAKIPPHKNLGSTPPEKRYEMVRISVKNLKYNFTVSDIELKNSGISYTYKTLEYYRSKYKNDILSFICGSDIFATINTWENWLELFNLANFIVVNRKEMSFDKMLAIIPNILKNKIVNKEEFKNEKYGKIILYEMDEIPISSSDIRDKLKRKEMKEFLTDEVYNYIEKNRLYQEV
ncbi:MAG: nicotinate-nucleotide adenylyltransferase [Deferribacterota bacterium]|nr:nicotinate-nucleotide adenylyltransferase [Deferribacterota bacterium]